MMEARSLLVGTAFDNGLPPHTLILSVEELARIRATHRKEVEAGEFAPVTEERTLYRCDQGERFAVHTVEEHDDDPPRKVGWIERYRFWSEVEEAHPDLARKVAESRRSGKLPPVPLGHPVVPRPPLPA